MLRAGGVTLAVLLIGCSASAIAAPCAGFTDVDAASPFCVNVAWMKNRGITLGATPTLYDPNGPVSRLQMAAFMYRLGFQNAFLQGGNAFGGVAQLGSTDNQPLEVLANGFPALRIEPNPVSPNMLAGFTVNGLVYPGVYGTSIGGGGASGAAYRGSPCARGFGCQNSATDHFGTIGGGAGNLVGDGDLNLTNGSFATVGGGFNNEAWSLSTVGGGRSNRAAGGNSTVSGGADNSAEGPYSTVPGGERNFAVGPHSIAFGYGNRASGDYSIASGYLTSAIGHHSVAVGRSARAHHDGAIVLADGSTADSVSTGATNQFVVRALGGFYFFTSGTSDATYQGAWLSPGTSAWAPFSDRDGKEEITAVDPEEILRKVASMQVSTWQWKSEPGSIRHMGPIAQDFHSAFGLGTSDKHIVTVDADGVALAAIQGLNAKLEAERASRDREMAVLRSELAALRFLKEEIASIRAALSRDNIENR